MIDIYPIESAYHFSNGKTKMVCSLIENKHWINYNIELNGNEAFSTISEDEFNQLKNELIKQHNLKAIPKI